MESAETPRFAQINYLAISALWLVLTFIIIDILALVACSTKGFGPEPTLV